jgi:serine/threonine-protein kinase
MQRRFSIDVSGDFYLTELAETLAGALGSGYTVERELIGGAMSRVFVAYDHALGRRVAVKVLTREVAAEMKVERFRLEIQLAARLQHPHIVPLLQSSDVDGVLYFTMPFVEGESLRTRLDRDHALALPDAMRLLRHVASALAYAHKQGVVHRDIKPDNVLIADEFALVTDFGVARAISASATTAGDRLTSAGIALGTPAYMAPEQALADPEIDHRADIYSFGVLAYETLTGSPPFQGKTAQATLASHVVEPPPDIRAKRADIPGAIADIVMQCLEKKPADRPQLASDLLPVFDTGSTASREEITRPTKPSRPFPRWILAAAAAALIIATGAYFIAKNFRSSAAVAPDAFTSVAVLPLVNIGGDKSDEYFSDGMTDELANTLAKLPGLKVASRTSAYAFKGKNTDIGEIGRTLNVQTVIEGTVRRSGKTLRVAAQLVNVHDGLAIWSDTYERQTTDVFSVQDDIARAISKALQPKLGVPAPHLLSESRGTDDLVAFDNYLRGRFFLNARGADNLRLAVTYLDSAITRDPKFGRAYAALAMAYALLPEYTDSPPPEVVALTHNAVSTALSIDTTLAEAYTALGLTNVHEWKFDEAGKAYRMALALDSKYPTAHQWYGELLFHTGKLDSSLAQIRTAVDLDPLAPINASALGYALMLSGKYDDAISELRQGIEVAPTLGLHHAMLAEALIHSGRTSLAIPEFESASRLDSEVALRKGFLAYGLGRAGMTERASSIIAELEERQRLRGKTGVALAAGYLGLHENDKALSALEQSVREHDINLLTTVSLVPDPVYDPLRTDPRFDAILTTMNLRQYAMPARSR